MLRLNRFAAAIDMIDAGTNAPIAIAANAKPANQSGKTLAKSAGTAELFPKSFDGWIDAAIAMYPRRAISPRRNEYAGNSAALRLTVRCDCDANTPVITCGYRKSASADPSASDA